MEWADLQLQPPPSLGQRPHGTQGGTGPPCSVYMDHGINAFPGTMRNGPDGYPRVCRKFCKAVQDAEKEFGTI